MRQDKSHGYKQGFNFLQTSPRPEFEKQTALDKILSRTPMGDKNFEMENYMPPNRYSRNQQPLNLSREASNVFENPRNSQPSHQKPDVLTPKHDLSMISGGAPGNVNEEESMNIPRDNFDLDDVRNSLIDFKQCAPPQPL